MSNYRWERIERLFNELQHEISRGVMEGEIEPHLGFKFALPHKDHVMYYEFRSIATERGMLPPDINKPELKVVK